MARLGVDHVTNGKGPNIKLWGSGNESKARGTVPLYLQQKRESRLWVVEVQWRRVDDG